MKLWNHTRLHRGLRALRCWLQLVWQLFHASSVSRVGDRGPFEHEQTDYSECTYQTQFFSSKSKYLINFGMLSTRELLINQAEDHRRQGSAQKSKTWKRTGRRCRMTRPYSSQSFFKWLIWKVLLRCVRTLTMPCLIKEAYSMDTVLPLQRLPSLFRCPAAVYQRRIIRREAGHEAAFRLRKRYCQVEWTWSKSE